MVQVVRAANERSNEETIFMAVPTWLFISILQTSAAAMNRIMRIFQQPSHIEMEGVVRLASSSDSQTRPPP